jgi:hypothetical protein
LETASTLSGFTQWPPLSWTRFLKGAMAMAFAMRWRRLFCGLSNALSHSFLYDAPTRTWDGARFTGGLRFPVDDQPPKSRRIQFSSFRYNPIGPLDQRNENRRVTELRTPSFQVGFRDPTGPGTSPSREDWNVSCYHAVAQFVKRRPTNRKYRRGRSLTHEISRLARQKDTDFMACVGQGEPMRKRERRSSRIVGSPRASHQDLESLMRRELLRTG